MRPYWAVFGARFRTLLQYRAAALAGCGTQLFFGLIVVMVYQAFYRSTRAPQPMTYAEVVTYVWLAQAMLGLILFGADHDVHEMIRSGAVAYELARPIDLYGLWYFRAVALRTGPVLLRMVPIGLVAGLCFGLGPPASAACAGMWALATVGSVLLGSAIATVMTISLLWTISGDGINRLVAAAMFICSGIIVPLPFFPDWIQPVLSALPFRGMADTPFRVYLGHILVERAGIAIAHQLAWTLGLILFGRWLLGRAIRRLVIQGG